MENIIDFSNQKRKEKMENIKRIFHIYSKMKTQKYMLAYI